MPDMGELAPADVDAWLDAFAACVRTKDYATGRDLFSTDATGFGTVANRYAGLDDLVDSQWSRVWDRTDDFTFDADDMRWYAGGSCTVAVGWRSVGSDAATPRLRVGRATLVLEVGSDGVTRAVHSHFSMLPGTES